MARPVTNFLLWVRFPIAPILKRTVFKQFCGGESIAECETVISDMFDNKRVCSILDYSVEGMQNEQQFDETLEATLKALDFAKTTKSTPFLVFKGTGLGRFKLFEKMSKNEILSHAEKKEWERVVSRFDKICSKVANSQNLKIMVDAEESWIQDGVDKLTETMMAKYNGNRAVVFNTVQLYRWDKLNYLKYLRDEAMKFDFKIGIKLVKGAYMEKERDRAEMNKYVSPICANKEATDTNFNDGLIFCSQNLGLFEIFLGTHNEGSSKLLLELMSNSGLKNYDNRIWFGQLYGMSDHISFNLALQNYNTAKYLPFGPVKEVIPYLFRRAEENTSVDLQTSRELHLIKKEIDRRNRLLFENKIEKSQEYIVHK
jgi:proline dehydrogenase